MDFAYDDEQEALRDAVRGLLGKAYGDFENRRSATDSEAGYDDTVWQGLAEMGVLGLPFAEEHGGMGAGPVEAGIVAEELGRVLAPEPFLTSVLMAGAVVSAAGTDEQRAELLGGLSEGAHAARAGPPRAAAPVGVPGAADRVRDGRRLAPRRRQGARRPGRSRRRARRERRPAGRRHRGVRRRRRRRRRRAHGVPHPRRRPRGEGRLLRHPGDAAGGAGRRRHRCRWRRTLDGARIVAGHEVVGHMSAALEATRDYLTSRKQFGVPLKTFQALTFRAADMYVDLELTRSTVLWATMVLDAASADGDWAPVVEAASRAGLQVSRAGPRVTQEAIQLHGGIGMTAEYSVGHHLSRVTAIEHQLGDGSFHLARLAAARRRARGGRPAAR